MLKKISLNIIKFYQKTLSPDHGPLSYKYPGGYCKFRPTCSEYCYEAISKYGFLKGFKLGFYRILRCHPFAKGGWDPVK